METTKRSQETDQTSRQESAGKNTQTSPKSATARERVVDEIKDVAEGAKEKLVHAYDRTADALNGTYKKAVEYGKENPGKTTLIAFGVGVGVGLMLANSRAPRGRGRFVPPVMNALSEIAAQLFR